MDQVLRMFYRPAGAALRHVIHFFLDVELLTTDYIYFGTLYLMQFKTHVIALLSKLCFIIFFI